MADTIAGRYTLIDPIARGGSGAVWRAWDCRLEQLCAAKVLRQRDSADLLRFAREQSVKLDHPHLLTPYGWAAEDSHVVIAMPLLHGGTLESALQDNGAASTDLTEEVLAQLLQALQFVHAQGWVHRDVKPANLMLESTGTGRPHVFLSDFGIAVRVQDARLTRTGTLVGTPGYLPPEAYELADPDPAQDLYAAGITALRMLEPGLEPQEVMSPAEGRAVVGEQSDLAEYVAALLTPDVRQRRDAAASVLHALTQSAPKRHFDPALTRDGEPFEIFDVLDPLPEPWATRLRERGAAPAGDPAGAAGAAGAEEAPAPPATGQDTAGQESTGQDTSGQDTAGQDLAGQAPAGGPDDAGSRTVPGDGSTRAVALPAAPTSVLPDRRPSRTRRRGRVAVGLLLTLLGLTVVLGGYLLSEQPGALGPTPSPTPMAPATSEPVDELTDPYLLDCVEIPGGGVQCSSDG
ncbi:hypothetical protein GCM10011374_18610 [Kocuria dechangensis]|uniref:non-specific serine/threonine protein kinase n=1 Tax=Kocuria dechangensis TaxID=1176249 RepID=A0A917GT99_9MICC|nr:serine/threonine-protein kinase [Kocuria dechangensis]GGG55961.1 hypothetical protein GCM10011374_18610 [Kocuria dechangensis]